MASPESVVVLFDVDNTLLDNDRIINDLKDHIEQQFGVQSRDHYFAIFEALRAELGYADYLGRSSATGLKTSAIPGCC